MTFILWWGEKMCDISAYSNRVSTLKRKLTDRQRSTAPGISAHPGLSALNFSSQHAQ